MSSEFRVPSSGFPEFDDFRAAIPDQFQILGLRLLPLSIGRYRLLKRFGCAFVAEEETTAGYPDLLLGLVICSMTCKEFQQSLVMGSLPRDIRRWSRQINPLPWLGAIPILGKWWRSRHSFNLIEKMQLFKRYIEEAQAAPEFIPIEPMSGSSAFHWSENLEVVLRGELNWSKEEIDESPLSKAMADYFKKLENEGLIIILDAEDLEQGRQNAQMLEHFSTRNPELKRWP
jgi:hypothetical protein